ncbi:hypothetical protein OM076_07020 [Solirubrobacter ginsenosidimutans]|uniref:Uncharacterized protein n=1 Tax=Solirubrobacter ginsenosidimutans TaxID=490573 RepID=A0A9X3S1B7_9ACTN|nr:hypothetical protein [Solirubrobacter ginsenosidimutans]MDA0160006.1 hypothetical protein [Solirubrobacter ginsenosidimutans]
MPPRARALLAAALLALAAPSIAAAETPLPDTPDAEVWTTDGPVRTIATVGETTYLGGTFSYIGPPTGAAVSLDGAGHATPLGPVRGQVRVAISDGAGGVYLGGQLQVVGTKTASNLLHVLADGSIDPAFHPPAFSGGGGAFTQGVRALALSGQSLYVGGDFLHAGAAVRTALAAVDAADGHLLPFAPVFAESGDVASVNALAVDGTLLYAGGEFDHAGGGARQNLALLNAQGQLLSGIAGAEPDGTVEALAVQGPHLYVGGQFGKLGASAGAYLRRYSLFSDQPDPTWLPAPDGSVWSLAATGSAIYFAGYFTHAGKGAGAPRAGVAAVAIGDASATAWDPAPSGTLNGLSTARVSSLLVSGGAVYVGGSFTTLGGQPRSDLAAVDPATGAATAWDPSAGGDVSALAATPAGIVAGGSMASFGGVQRRNLAALGENGRPTPWRADTDGSVARLLADGDTLFAGGSFLHVNGVGRAHLAALSAVTGTPSSFEPKPDGDVYDLLLTPDHATLYVAGTFATLGQSAAVSRPHLAAVSTTTGDPTAWRPAPDQWVGRMAFAPDRSVLYVSGVFGHIGAQSPQLARRSIAALTLDAGVATAFEVVMPVGGIYDLLPLADDVYVAGSFTSLGGGKRNGFAAVGLDGIARPFDPHPLTNSGGVLAQTASGSLLIGGSFYGLAGATDRTSLAEVDPATGAPLPWNPRATGIPGMIAVAGRHVWVGGPGAIGTVADQGLARFTRPAAQPDGGTAEPGTDAGGGTDPGVPAAPASDITAPRLSAVSLTRKRFAVAKGATALTARAAAKGTALRLTLSEAATARLAIERALPGRRTGRACRRASRATAHRARCTRYVAAGALTRRLGAGAARIALSGRLGSKPLRPGRYRLVVSARDAAGNASAPATLAFTVVRR